MKFSRYILFSAAMLALGACSEDTMDKINKNEGNPPVDAVPVRLQISDAIMGSGFTASSGDYSFYLSCLMEQTIGTGNNQMSRAELRNPSEWAASSTFNNTWNGVYGNLLNIKQIIDKIEGEVPGNVGQYDILGMAQTLWALNFGILTDMHGDIPYSEALQGQANMHPKLDAQADIYADILKYFDAAIANFDTAIDAKLKNAGAQDIAYNNNCNAWKAAAYALKARYRLHMSAVDDKAIDDALEYALEAESLGFSDFCITTFDGISADNPWSAYYWSRYYTASCETVLDMLEANDDPRAGIYTYDTGMAYPAGVAEYANESPQELVAPGWLDLGVQPIHLISESELQFIIAECQLRKGQNADAAFQAGVAAAVDELVVGFWEEDCDAAAFAESLGSATLQKVFEQKYLQQMVDNNIEAYNDYRRCQAMGEEYIHLNNPMNVQSGVNRFPYRMPYANSAVLSNPNVKAAYGDGSYIYSEKMWLFK